MQKFIIIESGLRHDSDVASVLEEKVNNWILRNPNVEIIKMSYTRMLCHDGIQQQASIAILYK